MNKSKFLKRSLATLLAILMVVAMVPSAFAAEGDPVHQDLKITVDTYSATQTENGDYTVTVWDSNDVTINWAPIKGTTLKLVTTGDKNPDVELDLPHKLYLAENAKIEGDNTYSVILREKVGTAAAVDHKLTIKVESTIPDNNATLKAVRVDNTEGNYTFGYITGTDRKGYLTDVTTSGVKAHAIKGEVDNDNETVTITLPFGMTPANVGFNKALDAAVFAPTSVHATSSYNWVDVKNSTVTVTAKTGAKNIYKVIFKQEKIFESFTNQVDLDKLEDVPESGKLPTLKVVSGAKFVPVYEDTDNVQRIMGTSGAAKVNTTADADVSLAWATGTSGQFGEALKLGAATPAQADMLKLITSTHANWTVDHDNNNTFVYLLVRTAANPTGAWLKISLVKPEAVQTRARITMAQIDNVAESKVVGPDDKVISLTVDNTHTIIDATGAGNTESRDPADPATDCYLHVKTDYPAKVTIPNQTMSSGTRNKGDGWISSTATTASTDHFIDGINAKSGEFTLRVTSADGHEEDYTVRIRAAARDAIGLKRVELRTAGGTVVAASTVGATVNTPFELEVPYTYHAGVALTDNISAGAELDLENLQLWVYPDEGANVVPGNDNAGVSNTVNQVATTNKIGTSNGTNNLTNANNGTATDWSGSVNVETPISNGWTTLENIWTNEYTLESNNTTKPNNDTALAKFQNILHVTVSNGKNTSKAVYQIKLKRAKPLETAEITGVTANKALDRDFLFSVANTLGNQVGNKKDISQAYAGAIDQDGNELKASVDETTKTIKIQVPYDWDESKDTLYLTDIVWAGKKIYRTTGTIVANGTITDSGKLVDTEADMTINTLEQEDQTEKQNGPPVNYYLIGFTGLTTSSSSAKKDNILYVFSEKDVYSAGESSAAPTVTAANVAEKATKAYKVYIEKVGAENTGRQLNGVTASTGVTPNFNSTYDTITLTVPSSYNWTAYRADKSKDFKLTFNTSTGALVIDKGQYEANAKIATDSIAATGDKYDDLTTGATAGMTEAQRQDGYQKQLNNYYDINDATFFVMDGELYVYDELSGRQTRITGVGGKFTNSNWGEIKTKQAEIRVYNESQKSARNYRLDLKVGEPSSAKEITSLKVGDVTATKNGSSFTASLPEDAEKEQALTIEASANASVMVNGQPYQADRKIDVSKEVAIVVTAEDGTKANYTLTTTFGTVTPPTPWENPFKDVKESDWFYNAVKYVSENGLMVGDASGRFNPRSNLTRAEFAQILYKNEGKPDTTWTNKFSDVKETDWFAKQIIWASEEEILAGYPDGKAHPRDQITREQLASLLWRYEGSPAPTSTTLNFSDANLVGSYAKDAMLWAVENNIMKGSDNKLNPKGNATRAEAAQMLMQYFSTK